jgi:hypothetical protein
MEAIAKIRRLKELEAAAQAGNRKEKLAFGHEKVRVGLVESGLCDMLESFGLLRIGQSVMDGLRAVLEPSGKMALPEIRNPSDVSEDVQELARFGEALRVFARDVQLSKPLDEQLGATLKASLACFDKALTLANGRAIDLARRKAETLEVAERLALQEKVAGAESSEKLRAAKPLRAAEAEVRGLTQAERQATIERAWLYAHRGAARMMVYWLLLISGGSNIEPIFEDCANDFEIACELMAPAPYPWSLQFSAFLHALRGGETPDASSQPAGADFDRAIELLKAVPESSRPASFQRSLAMLFSYNAVGTSTGQKAVAARRTAAESSISHGLEAVERDQDEFLAAYSAAVSYWSLYEMSKPPNGTPPTPAENAETVLLRRATDGALQMAQTRARNAISQALAAAVGVSFIRARLAWDDDQKAVTKDKLAKAVKESLDLQRFFQDVRPDLETLAMFIRDPAWQAIRGHKECREAFENAHAGYDVLRSIERWQAEIIAESPARPLES